MSLYVDASVDLRAEGLGTMGSAEAIRPSVPPGAGSRDKIQETFLSKMSSLNTLCDTNFRSRIGKSKVVILGAGIAGLMRAILAICNGNEVFVVEKRAKNQEGRLNALMLTSPTVEVLKEYGVYQYLEEHKLLGSSPNTERFPCSVTIHDLETAMKAVIDCIRAGKQIVLYQTQVERVITTAKRSINLILRTEGQGQSGLHDVDVMVVAEGAKSSTLEKIIKGRRVEVLQPVPVIGGIFKTSQKTDGSFSYNFQDSAFGVVLFTPGLCSIGCVPFSKNADFLKKQSQMSRCLKSTEVERRKKQFFKELITKVFDSPAAHGQKMPSFEENLLVATTAISSDFTLPFCGTLGSKSIFLLCGDALSQVDTTSGRGANTAINSAKDMLPALNNSTGVKDILRQYTKSTVARIEHNMDRIKCQRSCAELPVDDKKYSFALFQLKHNTLFEKIQNFMGVTLSRLLLNSWVGERCFRRFVTKF